MKGELHETTVEVDGNTDDGLHGSKNSTSGEVENCGDLSKQNDPGCSRRQRHVRIVGTIGMYTQYIAKAIIFSSIGPTMVSMELLLGTDTITISWAMTAMALGKIPGTLVTGPLYRRLNKELLFAMGCTLSGLGMATAPWSGHPAGYIVSLAVIGAGNGLYQAGTPVRLLHLWQTRRWRDSAMQALQLMVSVGATLGPMLVRPFLSDVTFDSSQRANAAGNMSELAWNCTSEGTLNPVANTDVYLSTHHTGKGYNPECDHFNTGSEYEYWNKTLERQAGGDPTSDVLSVRFAYIVVGSSMAVPLALFLYLYVYRLLKESRQKERKISQIEDKKSSKGTFQKLYFKVIFYSILFVCVYLYFSIELFAALFLAPLVVKGLGWSQSSGALITALFFGSHGAGRLLGVVLATKVKPWILLTVDLVLMLIGDVLMLVSPAHSSVMWVAAVVLALGCSSFYASMIVFAHDYMSVTGWTGTVLAAGMIAPHLLTPIAVGNILERSGYLHVIYYICGLTGCLILCLSVGLCCRYFYNRRRNKQNKTQALNCQINEETEDRVSV